MQTLKIRAGHEQIGKAKLKERATYGAAVQGHVGVDLREHSLGVAVGAAAGRAIPAHRRGGGRQQKQQGGRVARERTARTAVRGLGEGDEVDPDAEEAIDEEPGSVLRGGAAEEAVVHGEVAPQPAHELRAGYLAERPRPLASS